MIIIPSQLREWLEDRFSELQALREARWWRALLGGIVGMLLMIMISLWKSGFEGMMTLYVTLGGAVIGGFAGWGLTFVDDRARAEEEAAARNQPISRMVTLLLYAVYCLIGLVLVSAACVLLSLVLLK
jgi:hypothetical protein